MEETLSHGSRKKRKKTRGKPTPLPPLDLSSTFDQTTFPLLLAALFNTHSSRSRCLLKNFLGSLLLLLLSQPPPLLPQSFLSLFPRLFSVRPSVAALSMEVVGAASLSSIESNAAIASDDGIVKGMLWALGSGSRRLAKAACNALMDLATSPVGRERLRHFSAIHKLLSILCQVTPISSGAVRAQNIGKGSTNCFFRDSKVDNFPVLILDAAVFLINTSTKEFLDVIPEELLKRLLTLLKELWNKTQGSALSSHCRLEEHFLQSTQADVAAAVFRLSMNSSFANWSPDDIRSSIFGNTESGFVNFALSYWEDSPLLISADLNNLENRTTIFNSLLPSFDPMTAEAILNSVLQGLISCPPIASDEMDIFSFLNEVKGVLGSPIVYGQDIRVLRTPKLASGFIQNDVNKELHFFHDSANSKFIDVYSVKKCKEAFQEGYTIAIRGMEFRSDKIAAIADALAILFGQPSVGANIYLTPYMSQGLACHYDDHCVFVYQLYGKKQWIISPSSSTLLPRLYEPLCTLPNLEGNSCEHVQYLLKQGDILYIPRGCIHEAHTIINENGSRKNDSDESQVELSANFSLHVTLGIEVEPPFEWEGFAHVALHCWNENQNRASCQFSDCRFGSRRSMFVNLLHYAIRMIANGNPMFRKACMVAALPLSSDDSLSLKNRATFSYIIKYIDANCSFAEAFKSIKTAVQGKSDESLQWMRWLQHLPQEGDREKVDFNNLLGASEELAIFCSDNFEEATSEFSTIKFRFCRDTVFDDACQCFQLLLDKYRKVRRQYMNGMLSLHSLHNYSSLEN
ncbi:uncharacterized protein M6B38_405035 [Iris pallida]|uniref:Bifunctional lysine-specific demethylase and histidyl-hydroxylase n=1 Tax=Iris pallida TaxID=29817 RepID=A0AAX6FRQ7_IRIPA|nr:uncharacterized protein M6B38_405035 [Iris pallida]